MKEKVRIASGQGYWGDLPNAPIKQVKKGPVDYLVLDYLAEVTMSILQKQKARDPSRGYAHDFVGVVEKILPDIKNRGVKVVTNAGGINPLACKDAILEVMKGQQCEHLKVAVVDGDDILPDIDSLVQQGHHLKNMDSGEPIDKVKDKLQSANVYFGGKPIVKALQQGADIVITGRVTDTGLTLGPLIHEFDWALDDYDKMAAGTVVGHIIECGAQTSGGNFTDWQEVDHFTDIGFPIVEVCPEGDFYVTKHDNTDGLVNKKTVKEQLVYEVADPTEYLTPDCIADFTSIQLEQDEPNSVHVFGVKGKPATPTYKVSASYNDGYKLSSTLVYCWPHAAKKAQRAGEILKNRAQELELSFDGFNVELIGLNACNEIPVDELPYAEEVNEIQMRVSIAGKDKADINRFGKEIVPLILTGPSGVTGYARGRPKASDIVAYWPALLDKEAVQPKIRIFNAVNS